MRLLLRIQVTFGTMLIVMGGICTALGWPREYHAGAMRYMVEDEVLLLVGSSALVFGIGLIIFSILSPRIRSEQQNT